MYVYASQDHMYLWIQLSYIGLQVPAAQFMYGCIQGVSYLRNIFCIHAIADMPVVIHII